MNKPVPVSNIGTYVPMIDGPEKVSGRAKYTADVVGVNQLAGCIYRSPYAHGEIVDVDVEELAVGAQFQLPYNPVHDRFDGFVDRDGDDVGRAGPRARCRLGG